MGGAKLCTVAARRAMLKDARGTRPASGAFVTISLGNAPNLSYCLLVRDWVQHSAVRSIHPHGSPRD